MTPPNGTSRSDQPRRPEAGGSETEPRDAGARTPLEEQVQQLEARLAWLEAEKTDLESFLLVAAHELVEPLVMIDAYASLAADRLSQPEHDTTIDDLGQISRTALRLRRLVETMLNDARANSRSLRAGVVDCNHIATDVVALLRPEIEARGALVTLGELPHVFGEPDLLASVFINLLTNALKYGHRSGAIIAVTAQRDEAEWVVSVDDSGPAIPDDERATIFEPFRRGRRERRERGTGLGLMICRRIVERHHGRIGVVAGPRGGNRFYFTLPVERPPSSPPSDDPASVPPR